MEPPRAQHVMYEADGGNGTTCTCGNVENWCTFFSLFDSFQHLSEVGVPGPTGVPMPEYSNAPERLRSAIISVTHDAHAYHPLHVCSSTCGITFL